MSVITSLPSSSHGFQQTGDIFEVIQNIIKINVLTKLHYNKTINVTFKVLKNAPPPGGGHKNAAPGGHVFQATKTVFEFAQDIIGTNLLTNFHDDWTINVDCRVLTRKTAPPPGGHFHEDCPTYPSYKKCSAPWWSCFSTNRNHFELIRDIIGTDLLTKGHEDRTINSDLLAKFHDDRTINVASTVLTRKNGTPSRSHVFQPN
ncbi:hypothetical protein DPMN_034262 [Dreissena polymorpha]|uniref:Uncharacterized protein n=1 Tax=Dreissena polymorpha TaxID=45954 RepID=A0A9D4M792_DREPO|nr:hypothetical protein DPMN_034262 [Dreissena polymorpha]